MGEDIVAGVQTTVLMLDPNGSRPNGLLSWCGKFTQDNKYEHFRNREDWLGL